MQKKQEKTRGSEKTKRGKKQGKTIRARNAKKKRKKPSARG